MGIPPLSGLAGVSQPCLKWSPVKGRSNLENYGCPPKQQLALGQEGVCVNGWGAGLEGTLPLPEALRSGKQADGPNLLCSPWSSFGPQQGEQTCELKSTCVL